MAVIGLAIAATLTLWWASTGAILYLDSLDHRTFGRTMAGASILLAAALWGLHATSGQTTPTAAVAAFACGLVCWAWQLISFYTATITGPRKTPCPPDLSGWPRFVEGLRTSLHHELAAIAGGALVAALTAGEPNRIGLWTYCMLWWMHASAKLNVFLGVPNHGEELLPPHFDYLKSFMARRPMNLLFPISVSVSMVVMTLLAQKALAPEATPFESAGFAMLATLMALAVAEHWFLVAPLNANALWRSAAASEPNHQGEAAPILRRVAEPAGGQAAADDESRPEPLGARAGESWRAEAPAICDARNLANVLEMVSAGAFGEVDSVAGVVRTQANWVRFELSGRQSRIAPFAPQRLQQPLVVATGRRFDRAGLQAALDECAAMV